MSICLLISTYDRTPLLRRSLEAWSRFSLPDELIVIDDGSLDDCEAVCAEYTDRLPLAYVYNHRPFDANPCQSRNVGIRMTECSDVLTSEPEVVPLTDIVAQMREARERYPADILYGVTFHEKAPGGETERIAHFPFYTCYLRSKLLEVHGYDEELPQSWSQDDFDLNGRLARVGHDYRRIEECEALHAWHPSRITTTEVQDAYLATKSWPESIVANRSLGEQWGVVIPRP